MKKILIKGAKKVGTIFGINEVRADNANLNESIKKLDAQVNSLLSKVDHLNNRVEYLNDLTILMHDISSAPYKGGLDEVIRDGNLCLLKEVTKAFKKLDIEYFLTYGTLLGAIRHGGFIPWDDDIDVHVSRDSYEKILENFPLIFKNTPIKVVRSEIIRIYYGNTPLQVDIFPFDFYNRRVTSEDEKKKLCSDICELQLKYINYDYTFLHKQECTVVSPDYNGLKELREQKFCEYVPYLEAKKNNFSIFASFDSPGECGKIFDFDWIFPLKTATFMGEKFCIPNKPHILLKYLYGNYWDFPNNFIRHNDISDRININSIQEISNFIKKGI